MVGSNQSYIQRRSNLICKTGMGLWTTCAVWPRSWAFPDSSMSDYICSKHAMAPYVQL